MPTLTPIHRRMGDYVLANLFRAATMRIDELASVVGASVATANRFARALGFDGYPQFREALVRGFEATLAPVERLRTAQESLAAGDDVVDASLEQAANNLHATRTRDRQRRGRSRRRSDHRRAPRVRARLSAPARFSRA